MRWSPGPRPGRTLCKLRPDRLARGAGRFGWPFGTASCCSFGPSTAEGPHSGRQVLVHTNLLAFNGFVCSQIRRHLHGFDQAHHPLAGRGARALLHPATSVPMGGFSGLLAACQCAASRPSRSQVPDGCISSQAMKMGMHGLPPFFLRQAMHTPHPLNPLLPCAVGRDLLLHSLAQAARAAQAIKPSPARFAGAAAAAHRASPACCCLSCPRFAAPIARCRASRPWPSGWRPAWPRPRAARLAPA